MLWGDVNVDWVGGHMSGRYVGICIENVLKLWSISRSVGNSLRKKTRGKRTGRMA
jgi:hypothetical protein